MKEFFKKNKSFCILVIVIILIVFVGVISLVFDKNEYNVNYFDKIEDFSKLDDYVISEIQNDKYQKNIEAEESYLKKIKYDNKIVVEKAVENLLEVNCSVLGNYENQQVSEIEEVMSGEEFLTYRDKYLGNGKGSKSKGMASTNRIIPARISKELYNQVQE